MMTGSTNVFGVTAPSASTTSGVFQHGGAATSTIVDAYINSFSIATSTAAVPLFSLDTTGGGRFNFGTTSAPLGTLTVDSKNGTTTVYLSSPSGRTCVQMIAPADGKPYRLYINIGIAGLLQVEAGSCK